MIATAIAVAISGLTIFVVPGAIVLAASAAALPRGHWFAYAFAASLALLTSSFAACLAIGTSIAAGPASLAAVTMFTAVAARVWLPRTPIERSADSTEDAGMRPATTALLVVAALTVAAVIAAVVFAPVGSVDRWWYLAYVRGWLNQPVLSLGEPFLGTGEAFARFGVHPWLFGLATWSWMSGVDPVLVYERGAPVIVVLASVSATHAMACELFGDRLRVRLTVIAGILLWSGAMIPVFARAGEDKVLAAAALMPLGVAAFLRLVQGTKPDVAHGGARGALGLLLLAIVAIATAAVHALAYAFLLVQLLPVAALIARRDPTRRRMLVAATAMLLVVAVAPAVSGIVVRERLDDTGAVLSARDHPVVRVHEGRDRLIELGMLGYIVSPRLLLHPLALFALAGFPLLRRLPHDPRAPLRRKGASLVSEPGPIGQRDLTVLFLLTTTLVPLAIAFVPPLPAVAGTVIPPWMVYRVLWLLPLAPLAAITAETMASRFAGRESTAVLLLVLLGVPVLADGARARLAEVRARLAVPSAGDFRAMTKAVAALPSDSMIVAAPELAERIPAFTARHVIAALDRSTIVFSGSRTRGEARLRARAALLTGEAEASALARAAGVRATHAVFDPRSLARPRCGREIFQSSSYALCELSPDGYDGGDRPPLQASNALPLLIVAAGECSGLPDGSRRDPWSAAPPVVDCRFVIPAALRQREDLFLRIDAVTGRAADELRVTIRPEGRPRRERRAAVRLTFGAAITLHLPRIRADALELRIASSFLPVVRITHVAIATN